MADFDRNLQPVIKQDTPSNIRLNVAPAKEQSVPFTPVNAGGVSDLSQEEDIFSKLQRLSKDRTGEKGIFITNAELQANKRYSAYNPTIANYEDFAAYGQSNLDAAANGILKGVNLAATTFGGSLAMMVYGAPKALFTGKLSAIWDNEVTRGLDEYNNKVDQEYLPNYYTNVEKDAEWYQTDNWFKTNFLFDKLIKNAGFAVGAMYSGNLANAGLMRAGGAIGQALSEASQSFKLFTPLLKNTARAFSQGKNIEAAQILESKISSIADLTGKTSEINKIAQSAINYNKVNDIGRRTALALYSSAGEASFEALQTAKEFREKMIEEYKLNNYGKEPDEQKLKEINDLSATVGNTSFLGNMALLSATEYAQLPYLMGSSYKNSRRAANSLMGKTDEALLKAPVSKFEKIYKGVTKPLVFVADPKEGLQELGQYALQVGTQNYFNKAYQTNDADIWTDGFLYGFTGENEVGEGVGALVSKEGMESLALGAITGGLMQAKGKYTEAKQVKLNTQKFLNTINNAPTFKQAFQDRLAAVNRGVILQQQQEDAVLAGDEIEARDLQDDMLHNYLATRIKYGRFDMIMDDLAEMQKEAGTEEGLATLKQQGMAALNDTVQSFQKRLSGIQESAKVLEKLYDSANIRFSGNKKYTHDVIDKLVYSAYKIQAYDKRIPQLSMELMSEGIDTSLILDDIIAKNKPNKEATENALEEINKKGINKDELKTYLTDVIELSMRRKLFLDEYEDIKKNPENYNIEYGAYEELDVAVLQKQKGKRKPFEKEVEIGREYSLREPVIRQGNKLTLSPKLTVLSQTLGGEYQVKLPDGSVTFIAPKDFVNYELSDTLQTISPQIQTALDNAVKKVTQRKKYESLALPEDITLDEVNSLDNQELIDDIQKEFNKQAKELIKKEREAIAKAERMKLYAEQIKATQDEMSKLSDEVPTANKGQIEKESTIFESMKKAFQYLFTSTTTASIDWNKTLAPHIVRFNEFMNNAKNFKNRPNLKIILVTANNEKALGLEGLAELSFKAGNLDVKTATDPLNGFVGAVFIEVDGNKRYFVNKDGKRIGEVGSPSAINDVIFSTMPGVNLFYSDNSPRYREGEKEQATEEAARYQGFREALFKASGESYNMYDFIISKGIENTDDKNPQINAIGDLLINENQLDKRLVLEVVTKGSIAHEDGTNYKFPNGAVVFRDGDNLTPVFNKNLDKNDAELVFSILKALSDEANEEISKNQKVLFSREYLDFLNNILYFTDKGQASNNKVYFEEEKLHIGPLSFDFANIENHKDQVLTALQTLYYNVNNKTLKDKFTKEFTEFYLEDGKLKKRKWANYQTFLLSSKNPDGTKRSNFPVYTNISKPTTERPTPFKQKYAILSGLDSEFPQRAKKSEAKKPSAPTSELDAKKADIEKRRKEELEKNFTKQQLEYYKDSGYASASDPVASRQPYFNFSEEVVKEKANLFNQINKKYNDELAALEQPKPTGKYIFDGKTTNIITIWAAKKDVPVSFKAKSPTEITIIPTKEALPLVSAAKALLQKAGITDEELGIDDPASVEAQFAYLQEGLPKFVEATLKKELAEQPKKEETKPADIKVEGAEIKKINLKERKEPEYRLAQNGKVSRITDAEIELFKQWAAKNVPQIPYEFLDNIIKVNDTKQAWGKFEDGIAKIFKRGQKGTEYHEVFEAVWKAFLSDAQQQVLLEEFRSKKGSFTDRASGKKIDYNEATDLEAKERIADDFADFMVGKLAPKTIGDRIRRFFKAIVDFFKSFVLKRDRKTELFKAIDTGAFKNIPYPDISDYTAYAEIPGLSSVQVKDLVQDMTVSIFNKIFSEKQSLFNIGTHTSKGIFDDIKENYIEYIPEETYNQLVEATKDYLRTFNIEFDEDSKLVINDPDTNRNDYANEAFTVNFKKSSPYAIKLLLGTLVSTGQVNQENKSIVENVSPDRTLSSVGGYTLVPFGRSFNLLINELSNTRDVNHFVDKLFNIVKKNSDYVRLFKRLGGDLKTGKINFSAYGYNEWRLFTQFYQVFTKQKPEGIIQYIDGQNIYSAPANQATSIKQVERSWYENMRLLSEDKDSLVKYNRKDKTFIVDKNSEIYKDIEINTPQGKIDFLLSMGIDFPMSTVNRLRPKQLKEFGDAVSGIHTSLGKSGVITSLKGKEMDISGHMNKLASLYVTINTPYDDSTFFNNLGKQQQSFTDANAPSLFEYIFNSSKTLDELFEKMPQLKDVFSTNSQILKKGGMYFNEEGERIAELKVKYILGSKDVNSNTGDSVAQLNEGSRMMLEINQNLNGNYYMIVPGDGSTEWMMTLGNSVEFGDKTKAHEIFKGYLIDDILLAQDSERSKIANIGKKTNILRFFKGILSKDLLDKANELVESKASLQEINTFIADNSELINADIDAYVESTVTDTFEFLKDKREVLAVDEDEYIMNGLENSQAEKLGLDKKKMTEKQIKDMLTYVNTNYIINNIEYHKIIFGDPYLYEIKVKGDKVILDETKRIKSFLSPRRITFNTPEFNDFLNRELNKAGDNVLTKNDFGFHHHKDFVRSVVVYDNEIAGSLSNFNPAYAKTNEADAASWMMDTSYREVKIKNGQWSDEAEAFHQWQMAYTRQNIPGYKYTDSKLEKHDKDLISKPMPDYTIEVLKPIVSGHKYGKQIMDSVLHKFSQMPVYYSAVKGTNLEKLYIKMFKEGADYVITKSGSKVGTENMHKLYTSDGKFNNEEFNNFIDVPWEVYGIQVENSFEKEKQQTRGSQITKLSTLDLFNNGVAISEAAQKETERNTQLLDRMHRNGYNELLKKLGIEDLGSSYHLADKNIVAETLRNEMMRRAMSENGIDSLKLDPVTGEFRIPFEASNNYRQIKDILYSMVDKSISSPKMNGFPAVQVPVTMFEKGSRGLAIKNEEGKYEKITLDQYNNLSDEKKAKVLLTDDTLKFYEDADGKRYCEIMLPNWLRNSFSKKKFPTDESIIEYLNKPENAKILMGIGFRIPTQALSSIEVFKVKAFLPSYMGRTVVVPSEITTKAGSDFDIDKLNMYLKSVFTDAKGNVKLVELINDSEQETKEYYKKVYVDTIENEIEKITRYDLFRRQVLSVFSVIQGVEDRSTLTEEGLEFLLGEQEYDFYTTHRDILREISEQAYEKGLLPTEYIEKQIDRSNEKSIKLSLKLLNEELKEKYVNEMYKKALENAYYESLERLLTLPENFKRLTSPNTDDELSKIADTLDRLRGEEDAKIKNKILNRVHNSSLRHTFITGKRWIGRVAVNITGHSVTQKGEVYIKDEKTKISLPHNTVKINNKDHISLSGILDQAGKYISDKLSMYANASVDIVKDPYLLKIIYSDRLTGTFLFLERIGVPMKHVALMMNQPIIREYVNYLDSVGESPFRIKDDNTIKIIKSLFPSTTDEILTAQINTSITALSDNISSYSKKQMSSYQNAQQHAILDEFFTYFELADASFKLTMATNYDTASFKNADDLYRKQILTDLAEITNLISSPSEILNSSFIGEEARILDRASDALGAILKFNLPQFRNVLEKAIQPYAKNIYLSADKFSRVAEKLTASFLDYVVQVKSPSLNLEDLLVNNATSVARQLLDLQKEYSNEIRILKDLEVVSDRVEGAKSIKLKVNMKDSYDEDLYIGYMRELRNHPAAKYFYPELVKLAVLQGSYQSAISIKNIVPIEDYAAVITPIIQKLEVDEDIRAFAELNSFQKNNWKDQVIVPRITPRFYRNDDDFVGLDINDAEIYNHHTKAFPAIESLGISSDERVIMLAHPLSKAASYDVVTVPLIINVYGDMVDMTTGRTITKTHYAQRKAEGEDMNKVFGYQKVKHPDGTPVRNEKGYYVFKIMNLLGDGQYAVEHYSFPNASVIDNGTLKLQELPDEMIANYFEPMVPPDLFADVEETIDTTATVVEPLQIEASQIIEKKEVSLPEEETIREFIMRMKDIGMFNPTGDVEEFHLDLGMPTKDVNKALKDLEKYNFGTKPAMRLMEKMEAMRKSGYLNLIGGTGNFTTRKQEPIPPKEEGSDNIPCTV